MEKKDIYTLIALVLLTITTALFSHTKGLKLIGFIILALSGIKFLLVAFQFMELKKAHKLWKILLVGLLVIFISAVSIITTLR